MNKEQAKNLKIGDKLININTYSVGKFTNIDNDYSYRYRIYEKTKKDSYWWNNLDDWYTKEQLKDILVSPLQAINLLQSDDFFDNEDKFICEDDCNLKEIVKHNTKRFFVDTKGVFVDTKGEFFLYYNDKCMKFVPYIKPFTKQDLKSGMIVVNSYSGIGHIILNSTRGDIIQYNNGYIDNLSNYDDNLVKICDNTKINKIYKLKDNYSFNNYDFNDKIRYKLLWSRE